MAQLICRPGVWLRRHRFDESITLPRHRLDVSSARTLVAEDRAEAADDDVEAVIEIDGGIGPQPARDLFTSHQLAGPLDQQTQQVDGLSVEPDRSPSGRQAPPAIVKLEISKRLHHGSTPFAERIAPWILRA